MCSETRMLRFKTNTWSEPFVIFQNKAISDLKAVLVLTFWAHNKIQVALEFPNIYALTFFPILQIRNTEFNIYTLCNFCPYGGHSSCSKAALTMSNDIVSPT